MYKKVLLKLSGEALAGEGGKGFDEAVINEVAVQVKQVVDAGVSLAVVIGGGNFWRGRTKSPINRSMSDEVGILGTVMNALFTSAIFRTLGMDTVIFTPKPVGNFCKVYNLDDVNRSFAEGKVVFFAGGLGHPYLSTDTTCAMRAVEIGADAILLAKNIDGVYDKDPKTYPDAKKYDKISLQEIVDKRLGVIDMTASIMCLENNMPLSIFHLNEENSIVRAIKNKENNGTIVTVN